TENSHPSRHSNARLLGTPGIGPAGTVATGIVPRRDQFCHSTVAMRVKASPIFWRMLAGGISRRGTGASEFTKPAGKGQDNRRHGKQECRPEDIARDVMVDARAVAETDHRAGPWGERNAGGEPEIGRVAVDAQQVREQRSERGNRTAAREGRMQLDL